MPPAILVVNSSRDRLQSDASRIHMYPLRLQQKIGSLVDPCVAIQIIHRKGASILLLKTTSLQQFHMAHIKAQYPFECAFLTPLS
jgi:hypothetical protein